MLIHLLEPIPCLWHIFVDLFVCMHVSLYVSMIVIRGLGYHVYVLLCMFVSLSFCNKHFVNVCFEKGCVNKMDYRYSYLFHGKTNIHAHEK